MTIFSGLHSKIIWYINRTFCARFLKAILRYKIRFAIEVRRNLVRELVLTRGEREIVSCLETSGVADVGHILDRDALEDLALLCTSSSQSVDRSSSSEGQNKPFWNKIIDNSQEGIIDSSSPTVAVALGESLIKILCAYYREVPRLDYVLLTESIYAEGAPSKSQLWHRDYDDTDVVKLFVYLSDVTTIDDGPFTILPFSISDRIGFTLKSHLNDGELPSEFASPILGKKYTAFLVNTRRIWHCGSRLSNGSKRYLYTATFIKSPRLFPEPPVRFGESGLLDPVRKLVLSVD